jgi:hypothetical protein
MGGAVLMVLLRVHFLVKHFAWPRHRLTKRGSMRAILSFHVYAGVLGALLRILHTGHKFQSPLGITLVAPMLDRGAERVCRLLLHGASDGRIARPKGHARHAEGSIPPDRDGIGGAPIVRSLFGLPRLWMGRRAPVSAWPDTTAGAPG